MNNNNPIDTVSATLTDLGSETYNGEFLVINDHAKSRIKKKEHLKV